MYHSLFRRPDALKPVWNKARPVLYEYSGTLREAAIEAGLIEAPLCRGITSRPRHKAWQAQIAVICLSRWVTWISLS